MGSFVLIILITVLFCLVRDLAADAPAFLAGIETDAALLSLSVFIFVMLRVWFVTRVASMRAVLHG